MFLKRKSAVVLSFSHMNESLEQFQRISFFQLKSLKGLIGFTLRLFSSTCLICFPRWHSLFAEQLRAGWLTCDSQHDDVA